MAHDVFISYPAENKSVADEVCGRLEAEGVKCWIAPRDIRGGSSYGGAIVKAIKASRGMVLIFSSHANDSTHVKQEVERAASLGLFICTLRIEDVPPVDELDFFISSKHWLDASDPPSEEHLRVLTDDVKALLNTPQSPRQRQGRPEHGLPKNFVWAAAVAAALLIPALLLLRGGPGPDGLGPARAGEAHPDRQGRLRPAGPATAGRGPPGWGRPPVPPPTPVTGRTAAGVPSGR